LAIGGNGGEDVVSSIVPATGLWVGVPGLGPGGAVGGEVFDGRM
jgi:hypothetical protein